MKTNSEGNKNRLEQNLITQQQIGFARGIFQEEITIHTLLESLSQGVVVVDKSLNILLVNSRAEQIFGYSSRDIVGKPHDTLVPKRFRGGHKEHMLHYFSEPRIRPMGIGIDLFGLRSDGTEFPVEISLSFINTQNGLLVMSLVSDISIRKQIELALKVRADELTRINKDLESFSYSVSHDLKAPLNALLGFSQIILEDYRGKLDSILYEYLRRMKNNALTMKSLINDILNLSKISRLDLTKQDMDLSQVADSIISELQANQPDRIVDVKIQDNMIVKADKKLLYIALSNLFGNAWKFTERSKNARIEFGSYLKNGQLVYFVRDNGAGFDMEKSEYLFVPFRRLHPDHEFSGTGIGLSIVEKVIDRHGGKIWAEGEVGKGATFYFTLKED